MNDQSMIYEKLNTIFSDEFDEAVKLSAQTSSEDIEDWDSMAHINLVVAIEEEFDIKFLTGEVDKLQNVGEMVELIAKKTDH